MTRISLKPGPRGQRGEPFNVDLSGPKADRPAFVAGTFPLSYLADDTGEISVKRAAEWGPWIQFRGLDGRSAYEVWRAIPGNEAKTQADFFAAIKGEQGDEGPSAYQVWLEQPGNENKSEAEFFESLRGEPGADAYRVWLDAGNSGAREDFLATLVGAPGPSAYEVWASRPENAGKTEDEFIEALGGIPGDDGASAFEVWLARPGNAGKTEAEFFESLRGREGDEGPPGPPGNSFQPDQSGTLAQRAEWDLQPTPFSFYATDTDLLYWKASNAEGDWSAGVLLGIQGPEGPDAFETWKAETSQPNATFEQYVEAIRGPRGVAGAGVPAGGAPGEVLRKKSAADRDTEWAPPSGGTPSLSFLGAVGLFSCMTHETTGAVAEGSTSLIVASSTAAANYPQGSPIVIEGAGPEGKDLWTTVTAPPSGTTLTLGRAASAAVSGAKVLRPLTGSMAAGSATITGLSDTAKIKVGQQLIVYGAGTTPQVEISEFGVSGGGNTVAGAKLLVYLNQGATYHTITLAAGLTNQQVAQAILDGVNPASDPNSAAYTNKSLVELSGGAWGARFTANAAKSMVDCRVTPGSPAPSCAVTARTVRQGSGTNDLVGTVLSKTADSVTLGSMRVVDVTTSQTGDAHAAAPTGIPAGPGKISTGAVTKAVTGAQSAVAGATVLADSTPAIKAALSNPGAYRVDPVPGGFGVNLIDQINFSGALSLVGEGAPRSKFVRLGNLPTPVEAAGDLFKNKDLTAGNSNVYFANFAIDGRLFFANNILHIWEQESAAIQFHAQGGSQNFCRNITMVGVTVSDWPGVGVQWNQVRDGYAAGNRIRRTARDGFACALETCYTRLIGNEVVDSGDDAMPLNSNPISTTSYPHNILVEANILRVRRPSDASEITGLSLPIRGAREVVAVGNHVEGGWDAGIFVGSFGGHNPLRVKVVNNTILRVGYATSLPHPSVGAGVWLLGEGLQSVQVKNNTIFSTRGQGILANPQAALPWREIEIDGNEVRYCGWGWDAVSPSFIAEGRASVEVIPSPAGASVTVEGLSISRNKIRESSREAIRVFGSAMTVSGAEIDENRCYYANQVADTAVRPAMIFLDGLRDFTANGNKALSGPGYDASRKTIHGLRIFTNCSGGLYHGNVCPNTHHATAGILNSSAANSPSVDAGTNKT